MDNHEPVSEAFVEVSLTSGVTVLVRTLTPLVIQRLVQRTEELHPLPDKALYEKPLPNALPGTEAKKDVDKDPEYIQAVNEALVARSRWLMDQIMDVAVTAHDEGDMVRRYAPAVAKLRKIDALVTQDGDSDFMIVLRNFLAIDLNDMSKLAAAAQMKGYITAQEVADSRALFRLDSRRQANQPGVVRAITPAAKRKTEDKPGVDESGARDSA